MSINSGFFNSNGGDRLYEASDINDFFDGFVTEGVLSPVGGWLQVTSAGGMDVSVASGKAWFLKTWITNSQSRTLSLANGDVNYDRIDLIVLDFDLDNRENTLVVLTGTPAVTPVWPTLIDTERRKQVPLAEIDVVQNATSIDAGDITNKIGTSYCPWCTGLLQQASTEDLLIQWNAEFYAWMQSVEDDLLEIDTSGTLSELDDIRSKPLAGRNILINGDMRIGQRGITTTLNWDGSQAATDPYPDNIDRWIFDLSTSSGTWKTIRKDIGEGLYSYRMEVTTPDASPDFVLLKQMIEGYRLGNIYKGTSKAKKMVVSFKAKTNTAGTYIVELMDITNTRIVSKAVTLVGDETFHDISWVVPEDFTGQMHHDNEANMHVAIWLAAGSGYSSGTLQSTWTAGLAANRAVGQTNVAASSGNYLELTDIQLEVGSAATEFERRTYEEELALCKRYREAYPIFYAPAIGTNGGMLGKGGGFHVGAPYSVPKRDIPALSATAAAISLVIDIVDDDNWIGGSVSLQDPYSEIHKIQPWIKFTTSTPTTFTESGGYIMKVTDFMIDCEMW